MKNGKKKNDVKSIVIKRQITEIENLRDAILKLEIEQKQRDELISMVEVFYDELFDIIESLKEKGNEYNDLIDELNNMKKVMNQTVFKGRWKLIRFLLK